MKKAVKIILWVFLGIVIMLGILFAGFVYKVKNGFPVSYETEVPKIAFPANQPAILLFSKTSGFRHSSSIEASKKVVADMGKKNNWFVYETEDGGVFNAKQLAKFKTVIFNNSNGEVINDLQKRTLEQYVENGGSLIGIHGAGDNSHHWPWYVENLLGSEFSHHSLKIPHETAGIITDKQSDSLLTTGISKKWSRADEWYVFFENPRKKEFQILYTIDGEKIDPTANIPILAPNKNFGMGKDHPVAWHKRVGKGKTFYTSMGHDETAWKDTNFVKLIENAVFWTIK
ncbi:ThuA domain-containing protein [Lacihabitans sp. CCS-44]|uniref:ThuA domain-containing protein n=1 Tax=Lacihabitans sp. CCS-44 TaxID=2487331 RepID=UPI0020CBEBD1|nr:ThuA domain-containing protein [Lacihabitans sp. CCS-44]MCP9755510.1 ThuA domain-containing protein [Lacihabitans sp. CCS-44]